MQEAAITLVVPCFNEENRLSAEYWVAVASLKNVFVIFVDDGSTDSTLSEIIRLSSAYSNFSFISLPSNAGKAEAVRVGLLSPYAAESEFVGFLDADGAFGIDDISRIIGIMRESETSEVDCVWSSRVKLSGRHIVRSQVRHYLSRILLTLLYSILHLNFYDTQSGFKLFRTDTVLTTLHKNFRTRWFLEIEIALRFRLLNSRDIRVWEEPLHSWQEIPGSKVRAFLVLRDVLTLLRYQRK